MTKRSPGTQKDIVWKILINKYRADPDGFRFYLPEATQEIEKMLTSPIKRTHISTLTELERARLCKSLLNIPKDKKIPQAEAIQALEYCATLVQDESLPDEIDRKAVLHFIHNAIGSPVSKIERVTRITLNDGQETRKLAILRGIYLHLTWNDRLVAVSISPSKHKERSEAMRFVGIASDSDPNTSVKYGLHATEG